MMNKELLNDNLVKYFIKYWSYLFRLIFIKKKCLSLTSITSPAHKNSECYWSSTFGKLKDYLQDFVLSIVPWMSIYYKEICIICNFFSAWLFKLKYLRYCVFNTFNKEINLFLGHYMNRKGR